MRDLKEAGQSKLVGSGVEGRKAAKMVNRISDKLFNNTRYFIMKSNNYDNVQIAKDKVCCAVRVVSDTCSHSAHCVLSVDGVCVNVHNTTGCGLVSSALDSPQPDATVIVSVCDMGEHAPSCVVQYEYA